MKSIKDKCVCKYYYSLDINWRSDVKEEIIVQQQKLGVFR